jgi:Trypsin-co-occurring domain 2
MAAPGFVGRMPDRARRRAIQPGRRIAIGDALGADLVDMDIAAYIAPPMASTTRLATGTPCQVTEKRRQITSGTAQPSRHASMRTPKDTPCGHRPYEAFPKRSQGVPRPCLEAFAGVTFPAAAPRCWDRPRWRRENIGMPTSEPIGLSELIQRVKADLLSEKPTDDVPLFSLDEVKLELKVTITREGKGGINVHVVELGGSVRGEDVQTVTVTLTPWLSKQERLESMDPNKKRKMEKEASRIATKRQRGSAVTR